MGNETKGQFYVGVLDDGRFVAVATTAPYFCLKAETEEALIAKVKRAINFWKARTTDAPFSVGVKTLSSTVTTIVPQRKLNIQDVLEAA